MFMKPSATLISTAWSELLTRAAKITLYPASGFEAVTLSDSVEQCKRKKENPDAIF